jgi:hypothetical protein
MGHAPVLVEQLNHQIDPLLWGQLPVEVAIRPLGIFM